MPDYYLQLLGPFALDHAGMRSTEGEVRKAVALLAYLARKAQPVARSQLADFLWGETSALRGRRNLTRELGRLAALLPNCFITTYYTVAWMPSPAVCVDIDRFAALTASLDRTADRALFADHERSVPGLRQNAYFRDDDLTANDAADLTAAVALYRGEFLSSLDIDGCPDLETWLIQEREFWRQQVTTALDALINYHAQRHEDTLASSYVRRWLELEPWQEEAHRYLMVLLARNGKRGAALTQYDVCRRVLAVELAVDPMDETIELCKQIRAGAVRAEEPIHRAERVTFG